MITNKPNEKYIINYDVNQRLGNKTLYTNLVPNQNNVNVRYFSSIDAEIYFDDIFIDECSQINFAVQQQILPLYGYTSYVYDDIALGNRIINGQFSINFTKAAYMYEVLDTLSTIKTNQKSFTKSINPKGPLWEKTFDIYMSYGDARQDNRPEGSTILVLKQVNLIACTQDLDYTGKPIYETYSFVAKDIDFINEGHYIENNTYDNNKDKKLYEEIKPLQDVDCILSTDEKILNINFLFNKNFIIKSLLYKIGSNKYIEAEELSEINTTEKQDYIIIDTDNKDQFISYKKALKDINDAAQYSGTTSYSKPEFYLETTVEYEDFDGNTGKVSQKFKIL